MFKSNTLRDLAKLHLKVCRNSFLSVTYMYENLDNIPSTCFIENCISESGWFTGII